MYAERGSRQLRCRYVPRFILELPPANPFHAAAKPSGLMTRSRSGLQGGLPRVMHKIRCAARSEAFMGGWMAGCRVTNT